MVIFPGAGVLGSTLYVVIVIRTAGHICYVIGLIVFSIPAWDRSTIFWQKEYTFWQLEGGGSSGCASSSKKRGLVFRAV